MKITDWISSLLPSFSKDTLLEDIRLTRGQLDSLGDLYVSAADQLKNWKFKSEPIKKMNGTFKSMVGGTNPIVEIHKAFPNIMKNLDTAENLAVSILNGTVAVKGMTYKQAVLVQYVDAFFLFERYARKWLNYVLVLESAEYKENGLPISDSIPKPEIAWLEKAFVDFCVAFNAVSGDQKKTMDELKEVPDIDVSSSDSKSLSAQLGPKATDPFKLGFIATKANPIYLVRMVIAEWQVKRYKESKEELSALELRLLYLKRLQEGRPDAATEKRIRTLESRIQDLSADLADMEKDYA